MKHIDLSKKYVRLFRFDGWNHSLNDNWMVSYKKRDGMILTLHNNTTFYIPEKVFNDNLREGVEFISDDKKFNSYLDDYENYMSDLQAGFSSEIKNKKSIDLDSLNTFLHLMADVWQYFYKTEFYYLDKACEFAEENEKIRKNLDILYKLKERAKVETLNKSFWGSGSYFSIMLDTLSKQFEVPKKELENYGIDEIRDLYDGKRVNEETLKQRTVARIICIIDDRTSYLFGAEAEKEIMDFRKRTGDIIPYGAKSLQGTVTNKGTVTGKVKVIVSTPESIDDIEGEFNKMEKGDILVTETSTPELMPACVKAGAILADQGGLLSHAAVVSRELGIPSIVALKYATKIFQDGDIVEVDANEGIVKKIQ